MYIKEKFKKIADVDVVALQEAISKLTKSQWAEHGLRQKKFEVHNKTQTIPVIFDLDFRHRFQTTHPICETFHQHLKPVVAAIQNYFSEHAPITKGQRPNRDSHSYFVRIVLVKLLADSKITPHVDHGYSLSRCHRIHLPIISNEKVEFTIDGTARVMAEGELVEINNRGFHSVINSSDQDRVHMILDYVIPDEIINDPISGKLYA